jgi:hypothetical protein
VKVGRGVSRTYNGKRISIGSLKFMEEELPTIYDKSYSINSSNSNKFSFLSLNKKGNNHRYLVNDHGQNTGNRRAKALDVATNNETLFYS